MLLLFRGEGFDPNFYHRSKVDIDHCFYIEDGRKRTLLVPRLNESAARMGFRGKVEVYRDPFESLRKLLKGRSVDADLLSMNARMAGKIRRFCRLKDVSEDLLRERSMKGKDELAHMRRAARLTRELFSSLEMRPAMSELDLRKQILIKTLEMGLEPAFEPIVSTGMNTALPHHPAGRKRLGSMVLVDYGVRHGHYCSDLTRCFFLGRDRRKEDEYERLKDAFATMADAIPGLEDGKGLAAFSERTMEKAGFPKMIHAIGHGIGLQVHEFPRLIKRSKDPLKGSVISLEPAFYRKGYGMRFEDMIHFDGKRARVL